MKKVIAFILFAFIAGCASSGQWHDQTNTGVTLSTNNYKIVKAGAKGESSGFYLFGVIPIVSPNYAEAKENLYKAVNEKMEGRSIALANQTQDHSSIYVILFSIPKLTITADVVEFNDSSQKSDLKQKEAQK